MRYTKKDWLLAGLTGASLVVILLLLAVLLGQIVWHGAPVISAEFLTDSPGADMISGGIWPAIYGTVFMTLLMTIAGVPVGIATAIYLTEYASPRSRLAKIVRVAVNNLAGVPSIVFGLFGLGFFIIFVGGGIDALLYDDPTPVWGKPSILWASLTLAVLTLPVVIVTTEEALRTVPQEFRDASLALGATRFQTVYRSAIRKGVPGLHWSLSRRPTVFFSTRRLMKSRFSDRRPGRLPC